MIPETLTAIISESCFFKSVAAVSMISRKPFHRSV